MGDRAPTPREIGLEGLGAPLNGLFTSNLESNQQIDSSDKEKEIYALQERTCPCRHRSRWPCSRAARPLPPTTWIRTCLRKLDAAAANFHSTSADFEFDSVQTDPIPDTDVQKGTVYYERKGTAFQMAAHIHEVNGKTVPKVYSYCRRRLQALRKADQPGHHLQQAQPVRELPDARLRRQRQGSGARSGRSSISVRRLLDGVKTEKLELVAKDPAVRKNIPKVTIWLDTDRGVSLKQVFDEGQGQYRVCIYFNIKVNQPLPTDAFTFKTDKQTVFVNR